MQHVQSFHVSAKREEEAKTAEPAPAKSSSFHPIYLVPISITLAIPAIKYEWILLNEELQLATCFMMFSAIVYKQFGGVLHEALEADGKKIIEDHNKIEDQVINILEHKLKDVEIQKDIVKDAEDIKALKLSTYKKLETVGVHKPQYEFKAQVEKLVSMIATEEQNLTEKAKMALMAEATEAVKGAFATSDELKKSSLANALTLLKGGKSKSDPVKDAYIKFFKSKAEMAKSIDETAEAKAAREAMITKLNAVAKGEGFFFQFDSSGKPVMV